MIRTSFVFFFIFFLTHTSKALSDEFQDPISFEIIAPDDLIQGFSQMKRDRNVVKAPKEIDVNHLKLTESKVFAEHNPAAEKAVFLPLANEDVREEKFSIPFSFDGIKQAQTDLTPPDTQIAVGPDRIVEAVNGVLRLSTKKNSAVETQTFDEHYTNSEFLYDPRVLYDSLSGRFIISLTDLHETARQSNLRISISQSSSPNSLTTGWCNYKISSQPNGSYADYPSLGINEKWIAITSNNFEYNGDYATALIKIIDKNSFVSNDSSCPAARIFTFTRKSGFWIQPSHSYTTSSLPGAPFFMVSTDSDSSNKYHLWKIQSKGSKPLLSSLTLVGQDYTTPPNAKHKGKGAPYWTIGPEVQPGVIFRDGIVTFALATGCNFRSLPAESCIRIVQLQPSETGATILFEKTFGTGPGTFIWMPALSVNDAGDIVVSFQRTSLNSFLSVGITLLRTGQTSFEPPKLLKSGSCNLLDMDGDFNRNGDYTAAQVDPVDQSIFWIAGEYSKPFNGTCQWSTRVGKVILQ